MRPILKPKMLGPYIYICVCVLWIDILLRRVKIKNYYPICKELPTISISQIVVLNNFRRQKVAIVLLKLCEEMIKKPDYKFLVLKILKAS